MTFKNEYIPPVEQETSEFFKKARETLRTGFSKFDRWTIDREREMVMTHMGSGRELEDANHDLWGFIDCRGYYVFSTDLLSRAEVSPEKVAITYELKGFWQGARYAAPTAQTLANIRESLCEYGKWDMFNPEAFGSCQLTLIDAATGKEI